jgi:hypothetical protein
VFVWYIFLVLVPCTKKNLAILMTPCNAVRIDPNLGRMVSYNAAQCEIHVSRK